MASKSSYAQVLIHMALRYFHILFTNIQSKLFLQTKKNYGIVYVELAKKSNHFN